MCCDATLNNAPASPRLSQGRLLFATDSKIPHMWTRPMRNTGSVSGLYSAG